MSMDSLLDSEFCLRLMFTMLHFIWQGVAIALAAMAACVLLRRAGASVRYWVLVASMVAMAICPVATFFWMASGSESSSIINESGNPAFPIPTHLEGTNAEGSESLKDDISLTTSPTPARVAAPSSAGVIYPLKTRLRAYVSPETCRRAAPWVAVGYFAGLFLMLARLLLALGGGRGLRSQSRPVTETAYLASLERAAKALGSRAMPAVAWCERVAVPTVVGLLKPTILLPLSLSSGLSTAQVEMLLLHELAHLRRHDHWVNLAQWVVETALFFHPAVWFVSRRIRVERELACDDLVLAAGVEKASYADSLLRMAELSRRVVAPEPLSALALGSHGPRRSGFARRVLRLIEGRDGHESLRPARLWPLGVAVVVLLAGCISYAVSNQSEHVNDYHDMHITGQTLSDEDWSSAGDFIVTGQIVDALGKPMEGVMVRAATGWATLLGGGKTTTGPDGRYTLRFGPGMRVKNAPGGVGCQSAAFFTEKPGFFERNLCRHADWRMAGSREAVKEYKANDKDERIIVFPNEPRELNFVMVPAATVSGRIIDAKGDPVAGQYFWISGKEQRPASSVYASATTDEEGRFAFDDIPTIQPMWFGLRAETGVIKKEQIDLMTEPYAFSQAGVYEVELVFDDEHQTLDARVENKEKLNNSQAFIDNPTYQTRLQWGEAADGLIAAAEYEPLMSVYPYGFTVDVKLHIKNISQHTIHIESRGYLEQLPVVVDPSTGRKMEVKIIVMDTAYPKEALYRLNPGEEAVIDNRDFQFVPSGENLYPQPQASFWKYASFACVAPPGHYRIHYSLPLSIHNDASSENGKPVLLTTGAITLGVSDDRLVAANGRETSWPPRHFVRLVAGLDKLTFVGRETTLEELPGLLEKVPDRPNTVLELAIAYEVILSSTATNNENLDRAKEALPRLVQDYGFAYLSEIGPHMLGSRGTVRFEAPFEMDMDIPVEMMAGTTERPDVVKTQSIRFEMRGEELFATLKGAMLSAPHTRWHFRLEFLGENGDLIDFADLTRQNSGNIRRVPSVDPLNIEYIFSATETRKLMASGQPDRFVLSIDQVQLHFTPSDAP